MLFVDKNRSTAVSKIKNHIVEKCNFFLFWIRAKFESLQESYILLQYTQAPYKNNLSYPLILTSIVIIQWRSISLDIMVLWPLGSFEILVRRLHRHVDNVYRRIFDIISLALFLPTVLPKERVEGIVLLRDVCKRRRTTL